MSSTTHRSLRLPLLASGLLLALCSAALAAKPVPENLSNGLDKIVESHLILQAQTEAAARAARRGNKGAEAVVQPAVGPYNGFATKAAASYAARALVDTATGKYLVDIMPDGSVPLATIQATLQTRFPQLAVTALDTKYHGHGVIEGYIAVADAADIAKTPGVMSVILQLKPVHSVGAVTAQGVHQHRVNRIDTLYSNATVNPGSINYRGTGIQIGVMSDSFDSQPSAEGGSTNAPADVASGDLPGNAATSGNAQPVVVLQDYNPTPAATNEGRGMCQIVADIAPGARIGFATADTGEVGFANNIRALAALPGFAYPAATQQGFKADVICDDVSYLDEAMFQDGIIAQGVIDVVAANVTYCSSAANNTGTDGYSSVFRPVPNGSGLTAATNTALAGTNINLANVPAAYYAGGFHNFNPNAGQLDVAQTLNTGSDAPFVFQWNDPYDVSVPALGALIYSTTGRSTGGAAQDYNASSTPPLPAFTAGQAYVVKVTAVPANPPVPTDNFDAVVSIIDPNGNNVLTQDTGTDEVVTFFAPVTGNYTIHVAPFITPPPVIGGQGVPTQGSYTLTVNLAAGTPRITQDFNCLFFDMSGNFVSALASNNIANNRPIEIASAIDSGGASQVQMVISRSNTTAPANAADRFKYVIFGNGLTGIGPAEYGSPLTPVTFGHSAAAGANSVAAYSVFRPNIPEDFTSPGPVTIYFDANNNRLTTPQIRLKPDIAACDAVNNTFFPFGNTPALGDSLSDPDTFPNFSGTSAAAPHAAALAALVLESHGGTGSLTPAQVKTIFQTTAFPHDLDPYSATGVARASNGSKITIVVNNDNYTNTGTGLNDPNAFNVTYIGAGRLQTLVFNPEGTAATGGNTTGGNSTAITPTDFLDPTKYKSTPGMVFGAASTFKFGNSVGLVTGDVTRTVSNPAPAPATSGNRTLNLSFPNNNFTGGKVLRFNINRSQEQDSTSPQGTTTAQGSADLLGGTVSIPEDPTGANILPGMTFSGTIVDGSGNTLPFNGRMANRNGRGYSVLDGYGLINAEAAVSATAP